MTDDPAPPRRYDEDQVTLILKRATELHRDEPTRTGGAADGLTLSELEEIAREAGIDPRHLRRAAMEVDTGSLEETAWSRLLGEEVELHHEAILPGEIHPDDFERVVAVLQARSKEHGQPSLLGRTLTWSAETANKTRTTQVSVSARNGETHIRVEERLNQLAGGIFGGGLGGLGGGLGFGLGLPLGLELLGSVGAAMVLPVGFLGLTFVGCRAVYRALVGRRRTELARLMDAVVEEVRTSVERRRTLPPG